VYEPVGGWSDASSPGDEKVRVTDARGTLIVDGETGTRYYANVSIRYALEARATDIEQPPWTERGKDS
jgi:hypothetical protein